LTHWDWEVERLFIRNCLTDIKHLTVVHPNDSVQTVLDQMADHLSLPVTEPDATFVGIVSKRTIFDVFREEAKRGVSFAEFCTRPVGPCVNTSITSLSLNSHFEETIDIIIRHPFVPIVESGKLIGIVKRGDVNRALSVAFATNVEAHRLLLGLADVEGALYQVFSVTHRLGINVITAVTFDADEHPLNRRMILKVEKSSNLDELVQHLERAGFMIIEVTR
jgi:predicted transcriptional regulator